MNLPGKKQVEEYWEALGPGLTTGASDDDPSGIATYSQAGARFGFQLLWLALFTFPLMAVVQEMCARIGIVTGKGLAANVRQRFNPMIGYIAVGLLIIANTFNIGADLGAMAQSAQLVLPGGSFYVFVAVFTGISLFLQIRLPYSQYARFLKFLALALVAYVLCALSISIDWPDALRHAVLPTLSLGREQLFLVAAVIGTTISPYLFFWQTSQEVEERGTLRHRHGDHVRSMQMDVWSGMLASNVVMFFIMVVCAVALNQFGVKDIQSAAQAAEALKPLANGHSAFLFAIGIVGTGLLAVPVLAGSSAYALSETLGWKFGLANKFHEAKGFYAIIALSMILGALMTVFGIKPFDALVFSGVLNAIIAPFILAIVVVLASDQKIMGKQKNHPFTKWFGWLIVLVMAATAVAAIWSVLG